MSILKQREDFMVQIEFFHDVICSFCFPMSYIMRQLAAKRKDIRIIHRSFALAWNEEDYVRMFGSREAVTSNVTPHWERANALDELHRFNIDGIQKADFLFPLSKKPLLAAKAAGMVGGEDAYWDAFDAIQHQFFVMSQNIEDDLVLENAIRETGIDIERWRRSFLSSECEEKVRQDFELVQKYGIFSVPTLIVDGEYRLDATLSLAHLEQALDAYILQKQM